MTRAIHAGESHEAEPRASSPSIHMSSSFVTDSVSGFSAHDMTDDNPNCYTRWGNPTVKMREGKIAAMQAPKLCALVRQRHAHRHIDTSFKLTEAAAESDRAFAGDGVFRLSVGLEGSKDLIADLDRVL